MAKGKAAHHARPPGLGSPPAGRGRGFTLIEIAVVIGIIALIIGAILPLISAQTANARLNSTRSREEALRTALGTFLSSHGYLPCPASGFLTPSSSAYGHEARAPVSSLPAGSCDGTLLSSSSVPKAQQSATLPGNPAIGTLVTWRGVVPWLDLGLPEDAANDGWNQRITYVVSGTATYGYATHDAIVGMLGGLQVCNAIGTGASLLAPAGGSASGCASAGSAIAQVGTDNPALALISHGENGYGAFMPPGGNATGTAQVKPYANASASELANIDLAAGVLVQGSYSRDNDDIVLWLTPADLLAPIIKAGALPSMQALANQRFAQLRASILSSLMTQRTAVTDSATCQTAYAYPLQLGTPCTGSTLFCSPAQTLGAASLFSQSLPAGFPVSSSGSWVYASDGATINSSVRDPAAAAAASADPWGTPILFSTMNANAAAVSYYTATQPSVGGVANPYALLLYSAGPDGLFGTNDDLSATVGISELQAQLAAYGSLADSWPGGTCAGGGGEAQAVRREAQAVLYVHEQDAQPGARPPLSLRDACDRARDGPPGTLADTHPLTSAVVAAPSRARRRTRCTGSATAGRPRRGPGHESVRPGCLP